MSKRALSYALVLVIGLALGAVLQPLRALPSFAQGGCQAFPATGKTVCEPFLSYWQTHGGLAQQGFPLTNSFPEVSDTDGKTYTVQYFERAVFEAHPENQPPNNVLLSLLGAFRLKEKYPGGDPSGSAPPPVPPAATQPPAPPSGAESVTKTGQGEQKTEKFHLNGGDYTIDWAAQDRTGYGCYMGGFLRNESSSPTVFELVSNQTIDTNASATGTTHAYSMPNSSDYYLDMSTTCAWSVTIHK